MLAPFPVPLVHFFKFQLHRYFLGVTKMGISHSFWLLRKQILLFPELSAVRKETHSTKHMHVSDFKLKECGMRTQDHECIESRVDRATQYPLITFLIYLIQPEKEPVACDQKHYLKRIFSRFPA